MGKRKNFSIAQDKLRYQLSVVFSSCAAVMAAFSAISGLMLSAPAATVIFSAASAVVFLILLRLFMRTHSRIYFYISFLFIIFLFLPVNFFLNGGTNGGILYYGLLMVVAIVALLNGSARVWMMSLFIMVCGVLILLEYLHPELVLPYETRQAEALNTFVGLLMGILAMSGLLIIVIHAYDTERLILDQSTAALEKISTMDAITGISSRRTLDDALQARIMMAEKYEKPLSVILFDIDDFKNINDRYGHLQGDVVLKAVARLAKAMVRSTDELGRFGGEEFLILMDNCPLARAAHAAREICNAIAGLRFEGQEGMRITCSFGVVEHQGCEQAEQALMRVDERLYAAKRAGKNCVMS
jgi:diguanylate cyclase (GGDEF)-like protein